MNKTPKPEKPNMSGEPNSCNCGILPTPHSHLGDLDDGKSHIIRPNVDSEAPKPETRTVLMKFALDYCTALDNEDYEQAAGHLDSALNFLLTTPLKERFKMSNKEITLELDKEAIQLIDDYVLYREKTSYAVHLAEKILELYREQK